MTYHCDVVFTFTNGKTWSIFNSMVQQKEGPNCAQTSTQACRGIQKFRNGSHRHSWVDTMSTPKLKLFLPSQCAPLSGKVQKVRASIQEYGSISTGFSISLPSETGRGNLGSQRNTVHIFKISQTEKAAIDTSYEIFPCNVMSSLKGIVFFLWKSPTGSVFIN